MKAKYIIEFMNKLAPKELVDSWDNTGFQIGNEDKIVEKILIALDLDKNVYNKAVEENYHMIITHHPVIFSPIKNIVTSNKYENLIYNLIKNDIVVFNAHTNLDRAENGVSYELAHVLGLKDKEILAKDLFSGENSYGITGYIEDINLSSYLDIIKEKLETDHLIVYGNIDKKINKVAVCGGSGADFIEDAYKSKSDIYITGDIKYHDAQYAVNLGLTLIDAGHYHTEKLILPVIEKYLKKESNCQLHIDIWDKPSPEYRII